MTRLGRALAQLAHDLDAAGARWAVVGGLAVNVHSNPRTTRDIDIAVAVTSDREAEELLRVLRQRGYRASGDGFDLLENEATGRLATARLMPPKDLDATLLVDFLFAFSGIEVELVAGAQRLPVVEGLRAPVARAGDLIALKVLAGRDIDRRDVRELAADGAAGEVARARDMLRLIALRGFARNRDLLGELNELLLPQPRPPFRPRTRDPKS